MSDTKLDDLLRKRCDQDKEFYKQLIGAKLVECPDEILDRIKKHQSLFLGARAYFRQYADRLSQAIGAKLHEAESLGLSPEIPPSQLAEAFRKVSVGVFDRSVLNDFAGTSNGTSDTVDCTGVVTQGSADTKQRDIWLEVTEEGGILIQKATYEYPSAEPPKEKGTRLNAYRSDWGLVAWSQDPDKKQKIFLGYPLGTSLILWLGQALNDSLAPVSKNEFEVSLQKGRREEGSDYYDHIGFTLTADYQIGAGFTLRRSLVENALFTELTRIVQSKPVAKLLTDWRTNFKTYAGVLSTAIANAFETHRKWGDYLTAPLAAKELEDAFTSDAQLRSFEMLDFNQFASKWKSIFKQYSRSGTPGPVAVLRQTWLEAAPGLGGIFQHVTGSLKANLDPRRAKAGDPDLLNIVVDAYLPECGTCGCFQSCTKPDLIFPLIAYKLPGNRFLWVSQSFPLERITKAIEAAAKPPEKAPAEDSADLINDSPIYEISLEWIVTFGSQKNCYLVEDFFTIKFGPEVSCEPKADSVVYKTASQL